MYASTEYGNYGNKVLKNLAEQNNITYNGQMIDVNALELAKKFVENAETDIVLVYSDYPTILKYFDYLDRTNSKIKKTYIMTNPSVSKKKKIKN